jgi:cytosine permease
MANGNAAIPAYLRTATPVPPDRRAPWYVNTAPSYAGIFLWIAFYDQLGEAFRYGGLWAVLIGAVFAGAACHLLFYYVPGLLGMQTGLPLYIVGTSTFGARGGFLIPGIFMGLLQIGWYSVATYYSTKLILNGLGLPAITPYGPVENPEKFSLPAEQLAPQFDPLFIGMALVWGYAFALIGGLGIQYVARVAQFFPIVPILLLLIGSVQALLYGNFDGFRQSQQQAGVDVTDPINLATLFVIQMVVGFFGTAGAVGADFCSNNRNEDDVKWGGVFGIWVAVIFTAGLALITVAGAFGSAGGEFGNMVLHYSDALEKLNTSNGQRNWLAKTMLILFAIGSMAPACFCSFIIGNSLSTMLARPQARLPITLAGATVGILIAMTGASAQLAPYFGLIGASFGPVIGAMIADFALSGGNWSGPREGVNWAGYGAWLVGFLVGISNNDMVGTLLGIDVKATDTWWHTWRAHPTGVYSLLTGAIVYYLLARILGLPARLPWSPGSSDTAR